MKSITLVILLTICATSYAISCTTIDNARTLLQPLNGLVPNEFIEKIKKLPSVKNVGSDPCRVALYINCINKTLQIAFTGRFAITSSLQDQQVEITIIVNGNDANDFSFGYYLEYACSDDECEKDFIIQHFNWLFNVDYPELLNQLIPFILGNVKEPSE
jgi:hypothetical protein